MANFHALDEDPKQPEPPAWPLLNDELRLRGEAQRAAFERIEKRAAVIFGGAVAALLFVVKEPVDGRWLVLAIVAYLGSASVAGWIAAMPGRFEELSPQAIVTGLWLYPTDRAAAELANNRLGAFETNVERQARLVRLLQASFVLLLIGAMLSVLHLTTGDRADDVRQQPRSATAATSSP